VLIFAAIYVLAFFGGKSLSAALNLMMLGLINKLAGGIFGVVKFLLILSLVFYFAGSNGWINTDYTHLKDSVMYFSLEGFGKQLYELLR
jgi:membrane protein required for colicin V production